MVIGEIIKRNDFMEKGKYKESSTVPIQKTCLFYGLDRNSLYPFNTIIEMKCCRRVCVS